MANEDRIFRDESGQLIFLAPGNKRIPIEADQIREITGGGVENFLRSIGESASQIGTGAGAILGVPGAREEFDKQQRSLDTMAMTNPVGTLAGSVVPDIAVGVATGGGGSLARQTVRIGAAEAALGATRDPDNWLQSAAIQGAIGAAVPGAGRAVSVGARKGLKIADDVINRARAPARVVDDVPDAMPADPFRGRGRAIEGIGAGIESHPITAMASGAVRRQRLAENLLKKKAGDAIGVPNAHRMDDFNEALRASQSKHETFYQEILPARMEGVTLADDAEFASAVSNIQELNKGSYVRSDVVDEVLDRVSHDLNKGAGIRGTDIITLEQEMGLAAKMAAQQGNHGAAESFKGVQSAVQDATERALGKIDKEFMNLYRQIKGEYAARMSLQKGTAVSIDGSTINANSLAKNLVNQYSPRAKNRPIDNELFEIARAMLARSSRIPDSGTATRQATGQIITGGLAAAGLSLLGD